MTFLAFPPVLDSLSKAFLGTGCLLCYTFLPPWPQPKAVTQVNSWKRSGFFLKADQLPQGPSHSGRGGEGSHLITLVPGLLCPSLSATQIGLRKQSSCSQQELQF